MTLKIYENKKVVKTYDVDTYDLMFGTLEDVAGAINLDKLQTGSNAEIIKTAGDFVIHSMGTVKNLLKDIFPGLTDAEIRGAKLSDIAAVLVDVIKYTIQQLNILPKSKN